VSERTGYVKNGGPALPHVAGREPSKAMGREILDPRPFGQILQPVVDRIPGHRFPVGVQEYRIGVVVASFPCDHAPFAHIILQRRIHIIHYREDRELAVRPESLRIDPDHLLG